MSAMADRSDVVSDPVGHISISGVHGGEELAERIANSSNGTRPVRVARASSRGSIAPLLLGALAGMAVMYLFDPRRGNRRRALLRDRLVHALHEGADTAGKRQRDLRNRATGAVAELRGHLRHDKADDDIIVDRVRSAIGRVASHPSSIEVKVHDREVTLSGPVFAEELDPVLETARRVKGVGFVVNHLDIHQTMDDV
jgi:hypothetical protein